MQPSPATPPPLSFQQNLGSPSQMFGAPYANYAGSLPPSSGYAGSNYNQNFYDGGHVSDGGYHSSRLTSNENDLKRFNSLPRQQSGRVRYSIQPFYITWKTTKMLAYIYTMLHNLCTIHI